jgi:hypothetical protein
MAVALGLLVCSTALLHSRCWAHLQVEGGEDEPKKYKKANLGLSNKLYYNDEVSAA